MATNTYVALDKVTVSGSTTNTVTFSSIPSTYTDLVIVANGYTLTTDISQRIRFNSDTGTNYSLTYVGGNGTSASSGRTTSGTGIYANYLTGWSSTSTQPGNWVFSIMNYANSTTYKTCLSRANQPVGSSYPGTEAVVGLWRNTAAITSLTIEAGYSSSHYFAAGTTLSLYGIKAEGASGTKATGGAIYSDSTYYYHVFGSTGTFTPSQSLTADVLVVAGGGGGGHDDGGGGGAGGLAIDIGRALSATGYSITVGAGGANGYSGVTGYSGSPSVFGTITATGGGGGGTGNASPYNGLSGGSGGGASYRGSAGTGTTGTSGGATLYGNSGGASVNGGIYPCGGGGGAGAAATAGSGTVGGNGGNGRTDSLIQAIGLATGVGENVSGTYYIAGGGGGSVANGSTGGCIAGYGGGGLGERGGIQSSTSGKVSTGGGGGGGANAASSGASGVVVVRYAKV